VDGLLAWRTNDGKSLFVEKEPLVITDTEENVVNLAISSPEPPPPPVKFNTYIFIQISIFDSLTGNVTRDIALGSRKLASNNILSSTSEWQFTQMLNLPAATPPRTRDITVTYWVRSRDPAFGTLDPVWGDPNLVYLGPVVLGVKRYDPVTTTIFAEFSVNINLSGGVTQSYSVIAAQSGAELRPISLTP
jgi:hypothetical protein